LNEEYAIHRNTTFLQFMFQKVLDELTIEIPNSYFREINAVVESNSHFLKTYEASPALSKTTNRLILVLKICILTLFYQYISFKVSNKSEFAKFWKGSVEDYLDSICKALNEFKEFNNQLTQKGKVDMSLFSETTGILNIKGVYSTGLSLN
jgi:hypothetical protein